MIPLTTILEDTPKKQLVFDAATLLDINSLEFSLPNSTPAKYEEEEYIPFILLATYDNVAVERSNYDEQERCSLLETCIKEIFGCDTQVIDKSSISQLFEPTYKRRIDFTMATSLDLIESAWNKKLNTLEFTETIPSRRSLLLKNKIFNILTQKSNEISKENQTPLLTQTLFSKLTPIHHAIKRPLSTTDSKDITNQTNDDSTNSTNRINGKSQRR